MRLRLDPEIHISDNLRIVSEIFALDNLVLGSTPDSYAISRRPQRTASTTGVNIVRVPVRRLQPLRADRLLLDHAGAAHRRRQRLQNSISVQRVWAEYMTPVGQLRFGRMPGHWGLGMVENSGDGIDSDYQTTLDRIMFITGIKSMDLYFGGAWDFVSTGPTNATAYTSTAASPTTPATSAT